MNKKHGFTLAETLISITIVGLIAAILLPMASKLKPNDNKALYLKAYDMLGQAMTTVTSSKEFYPNCKYNGQTDIEKSADCSDYPLFNTDTVDEYGGDNKLCKLLVYTMYGKELHSCSSSVYSSYKDDSVFSASTFTTQNGMLWRVSPQTATEHKYNEADKTTTGTFEVAIYVDINGKNGNNCIYSDTCKNPDRFKFLVDASGGIFEADAMGVKYLKSRTSMVSKDIPDATAVATNIENAEKEKTFTLKNCQ